MQSQRNFLKEKAIYCHTLVVNQRNANQLHFCINYKFHRSQKSSLFLPTNHTTFDPPIKISLLHENSHPSYWRCTYEGQQSKIILAVWRARPFGKPVPRVSPHRVWEFNQFLAIKRSKGLVLVCRSGTKFSVILLTKGALKPCRGTLNKKQSLSPTK